MTIAKSSPALHLTATSKPSKSHFGGSPRLINTDDWPRSDILPLNFIARISLPEVQAAMPIDWLPKTGALLFFYDTGLEPWGFDPLDADSRAVLHVDDLDAPLTPEHALETDESGKESCISYARINVDFKKITMPASPRRPGMVEPTYDEDEHHREKAAKIYKEMPRHQFGGFPLPVQGDDMEMMCQLASNGLNCGHGYDTTSRRGKKLAAGADDWRLLLQVDSDDDIGWMWGDCGTLYFWIREADTAKGDFSNPWVILQCS